MEQQVVLSDAQFERLLEEIGPIKASLMALNSGWHDVAVALLAILITGLLGWITIRQQNIAKKQFDALTQTNELANKQHRVSMIENNLDVLQRLNEVALSSPENLEAAFTSVNRTEADTGEYNEEAARKIFFHYLRINRMYRAWLLKKNDLMGDDEYSLIVDNYAGTLKSALPQITLLAKRGYDNDFITEISDVIRDAEPIQPIPLTAQAG